MGGCATKPKADPSTSPASAPEPAKDAAAAISAMVLEVKEVVVIEREKEVPLDDANKRQSLSNLFKENEGKESSEDVEKPTETKTLEKVTVSEKAKDLSGEEATELEKIDTSVEQIPGDVIEVPVVARIDKAEMVEAKTETQEPEEKKEIMEETPVPVEAKINKAETVDVNAETQKSEESKTEAPEEENVFKETSAAEAEKPEAETTLASESSEEKKSVEEKTPEEEKFLGEKLATETRVPETSEEKKVAEEIPVEETKNSAEKKTEEEK